MRGVREQQLGKERGREIGRREREEHRRHIWGRGKGKEGGREGRGSTCMVDWGRESSRDGGREEMGTHMYGCRSRREEGGVGDIPLPVSDMWT